MQLRVCPYDDNTDMLTVIDVDSIVYHYHCYEIENV